MNPIEKALAQADKIIDAYRWMEAPSLITIDSEVVVQHEQGTERGVVTGVQRDPHNGTFYVVRFPDNTYSTWPARCVTGA